MTADLERLALAATPGPWKLCHHLQSPESDKDCPCGYRGAVWGPDGEHILFEMGSTETPGQEGMEPPRYERSVEIATAQYIAAANPTAILALLAELKAARNDALEEAAKHIDTVDDGFEPAFRLCQEAIRKLKSPEK